MNLKTLNKNNLTNSIAVLVGTRPGIIKMSPLIRILSEKKADYFVIHAGQHYSYNMDKIFFEDLKLPLPGYVLTEVKKYKLHGEQTAEMIKGIESILINKKPRIILVCGDANFNLAGALAARKLHIDVAHVESGLRSNDWNMPEEHNRIIIDHISDYLFAPTELAKNNLIRDNVKGKIKVVGNIIVDAVNHNLKIANEESHILNNLNIKEKEYFVLTIHREENVDNINNLKNLVESIKLLSNHYSNNKIIFPIHPRTQNRLNMFKLNFFNNKNIIIIPPLGYLDFLKLLFNARIILTDSGGIQEEACILKVPCVTLRDNTERPETVFVGANKVVGTDPDSILNGIKIMMNVNKNWENPFGDGDTAKKIIQTINED
jgi:UDP-N-acetylglucosamine 2-epimerase (non-hydrolysing)